MLIEQARLKNGDKVVDVGSGSGTLSIWIKRKYPEVEVTGLDGDQQIIAIAREKSDKQKLDINYTKGLSYEMPFANNSFDHCFSSLFFHHLTLKNKEATFQEMVRIVKPGGSIEIADWGKPANFIMRLLYYQIQLLDGFATTAENIEGKLPELMEKVGFLSVQTKTEVSTMFGTMTLYQALKPK